MKISDRTRQTLELAYGVASAINLTEQKCIVTFASSVQIRVIISLVNISYSVDCSEAPSNRSFPEYAKQISMVNAFCDQLEKLRYTVGIIYDES
jgi:hypothetical protein